MSEQSGAPEQPQQPEQPEQPPSPYGVPPDGQGQRAYPPPPYGYQQPAPPYGQPYGQPAPPPYGQASYGMPGYPMPGYGPAPRDPDARPGTVLAAGIITLVMTGLSLLMLLVFTLILVAARSAFLEGFNDSAELTTGDPNSLFAVILVVMLVFIVWCVAAIVLAILALRRKNWARICLVVSSALTAVLALISITGGVSVLPLACAIAVIVCLFTGGAGDWFHHEHPYSQPQVPQV